MEKLRGDQPEGGQPRMESEVTPDFPVVWFDDENFEPILCATQEFLENWVPLHSDSGFAVDNRGRLIDVRWNQGESNESNKHGVLRSMWRDMARAVPDFTVRYRERELSEHARVQLVTSLIDTGPAHPRWKGRAQELEFLLRFV